MQNKNQKGVSIYLTVVMMSILLSAVLGMAAIIIGGSKIAETSWYSVMAFHIADSGMEKALYALKYSSTCESTALDGNFGSTDYSYDITMTNAGGNCTETGTKITSLGQYLTVKRNVEASY